ncbi:Flavin-binding monooxygenase-like protein [Ancylostoma duodenale]|uniref:Flavin-containing monooxygenase n=1 Tax=Ancylostoma duodenale TaxID=51022 RepID=A0A0C2GHL8_9BILA|nr:Flavin-binding monooxygenase-like protein [Ancylostoma duodenale]
MKRVAIVGAGPSGLPSASLSLAVCRSSPLVAYVYLSTRRGAWILNRVHTRGMPLDICMTIKSQNFSAHTTQNDELPIRLASGTILVKPNIDRFTEHDVYFTDGSKVENIDYVVLSTGYDITFPIVEGGALIKVDKNRVELYKYMYPLDQPHNTFAVIGLIQPLGSIMPVAEMQARVFFSALSGESTLPCASEMRKDVLDKRERMRKHFVDSHRHTLQV